MQDFSWAREVEDRLARLRKFSGCSEPPHTGECERAAVLEMQVEMLTRILISKGLITPDEIRNCLREVETNFGHPDVDLSAEAQPFDSSPAPDSSRWHAPHGRA